jgi:flagellar motility protein MotE (MotC chaperone)
LHATEFGHDDQAILRQAKQLRQYKSKLEQRMKILEEHNEQLEKQLQRSKQLLINEVNCHHHQLIRLIVVF